MSGYRITSTWHIHLGEQINRGGETRINGIEQRNPTNNNRVMAGITLFLPEQQIALRTARDTRIDNGFRTNHEIALRYQHSF
jgi:hypothetical protein